MKSIACFLLLSFAALPLYAQSVPCGKLTGAKACPTSGSTLLDDTYPAAAQVISFEAFNDSPTAAKVPAEFILKVLESHNYSSDSPPILVPSEGVHFDQLKQQLEQKVRASGGKIPESVLDKVVHVEGASYTWQQDYFESFFDPATGSPVLRQIESYSRMSTDAVSKLTGAGAACKINEGATLTTELQEPAGSFGNGEMGGNIEGLPGGLCLFGENQSKKFAAQYCGGEENQVQVDVSWLEVGHVDEVFKILPQKVPGVPEECSFSLMYASPKKALELLKGPRTANHNLFSVPSLSAASKSAELEEFRQSRTQGTVGTKICDLYEDHIVPARNKDSNKGTEKGAKGAFLRLKDLIVAEAHAGIVLANSKADCKPDTITNREFAAAFEKDPKLVEYNEAVQKKMEESRDKIMKKILERLPHCQAHIKVIEAPDLFYGTLKVNRDGTKELPRAGRGGSFFPNPTNGVISNSTMIFSDPQNQAFRDHLTRELKRTGLKSTFIDTWDYSHLGDGNLHCSSHTIPYCSPVKVGGK